MVEERFSELADNHGELIKASLHFGHKNFEPNLLIQKFKT